MRVNVKLMGWLRHYLREGIEEFDDRDLDLAAGETVGGLASALGFRDELDFLALLNGERVPTERFDQTTLNDGDALVYIPPLKGG
jgi:sulfur carrier protein ThiS